MNTSLSLERFLAQFNFQREKVGYLGVEVEFFLADRAGVFVPKAVEFLNGMQGGFTYELSRCQGEFHTNPCSSLDSLQAELSLLFGLAAQRAEDLGLSICSTEVGPESMDLTVYPDQRYIEEVVPRLTVEQLRAACRVAGVHIHVGMGSIKQAIFAYNRLRRFLPKLIELGDGSCGERMRLYRLVAPNCDPPLIRNAEDFYRIACELGFVDNPRNCWHLIRISQHGTVEVRVFGSTDNIDQILSWAKVVRKVALGR